MSIDISKIKVVAFDLFGTVFDLSGVPKQEIRDYIAHVRKLEWSPLVLPDSWKQLPLHPDSKEGILRISDKYETATCSNAPTAHTAALLYHHNLMSLLEIVNIAASRVFKPDPKAYLAITEQVSIGPWRPPQIGFRHPEPHEVLMVTGNEGSPDVEGARAVGMQSILIRQPGTPQTIIELAELLGC